MPEGKIAIGQPAEWLAPRLVLLCEPSIETLLGLLGASSANYLYPFSLASAQAEHREFRAALQAAGATVLDLRDALAAGAEEPGESRERLERWARASTSYDFDDSIGRHDRVEAEAHFTRTIRKLDALDLADLVLLRPTVRFSRHVGEDAVGGIRSRFELAPLADAHYMRDPLTTTPAGCVVGRLSLDVRSQECDVAAFALEQLGIRPILRIKAPGTMEGGDFIPCGRFVLQGQGLLTNAAAIDQCLGARAYGFVEVGVVHDPRAQAEESHLDTYFTVFDENLCALCEDRFGEDGPIVEVYEPEGTPSTFHYRRTRSMPFIEYLEEKGMQILRFSPEDRDGFACGGLLVGPRAYLTVANSSESWFKRLDEAGVKVDAIQFEHLTGGYGGPHCASQVLIRA